MISIKNNSLKSLSAGITTRAGGGKVAQYSARKAGQPTSGTKVKPAAPTLKAVETAKPPKAPTRSKPFVVSKALAASKVLNVAPAPGTLKPVAACKPLNIVKRSSAPKVTKASGLFKTSTASKVGDVVGAADTPKLPPGLKAPGSPKTYAAAVAACKPLNIVKRSSAPKAPQAPGLFKTRPASKVIDTDPKVLAGLKAPDASKTTTPRISAVEAVRRQISEQKQKAAAVTARKAKGKSEPLPSAKPKAVATPRSVTPPSAPAMRPKTEVIKAEVIKAEVITASANAAENVPFPRSPARRPLPAIRKGGVRKPLAAVSHPSSTSSPPSSPPHIGGGRSRHQRNSLSAAERLSERALTRRNAIRVRDPIKPRSSMHAAAVTRSSSAPLLGWAKAVVSVPRSKSGSLFLGRVVKPVVLQPMSVDAEVEPKALQIMNLDTPSGDEGAVDASATVKVDADTSTISTLVGSDENASVCAVAKVSDADTSIISTLVGSDESASAHESLAAPPRFQIEIQDFDVQSDTFPAPRARDSMSSLSSLSFSSILDMFPPVPVGIPGPLTQDVHRQLMEMSPTFAADKIAVDEGGFADESMSNASSTSSISSILDQFPIIPTFIPRPLPHAAHRQLAAMIPATATDKVAADDVLPDGNLSNASSASSISSILDQFPIVPTFIPRPLPRTAHLQLASTSPTSAVDKPAADGVRADGNMSSTFSVSSISSILDQFPVVPTFIPRPLPQRAHQHLVSLNPTFAADTPAAAPIPADKPAAHPAPADKPAPAADPAPADDDYVRISIISLDGDAPVLDTPAAWKAAFDTESTAVGSSVSSHKEKAPGVSKAVRGVKGWWKRVVGKK